MKTYNSGSVLAQKSIWRRIQLRNLFLSVNNERAKRRCAKHMDQGSSYRGHNTFKKLFTQKILNKQGLKQ